MAAESTPGARLLDEVAQLGFAIIGHSRGGRPIHGGRLDGRGPGGSVLVMAGIHGDEPASVGAVIDLVRERGKSGSGGSFGALAAPLARPIDVVPALNPDGIAAGSKNSAADVDLNRNFPARNFTAVHEARYCPGPVALSEPETAAFAALIERIQPAAVVAVHAPFACINHDGPAAAWAANVAAACGWPARADLGYPTPGSLGSWLGVDRGLPILTIELPPGPLEGFRAVALAALGAAILHAPTSTAGRAA